MRRPSPLRKKSPFLRARIVGLAIAATWLLAVPPARAERNVTSLPFDVSFDADDYGDLLWLTEGATHRWVPGGWSGGAARFTPCVGNEGYSGVGSFTQIFANNGAVTELHLRFLIYHGATFQENAPGNKLVIMNRVQLGGAPFPGGRGGRPMIISREWDPDPGNPWVTWGACDGTVCRYEAGVEYWPDGTDSLRIGDAPVAREEEWIAVELAADTVAGTIDLFVWTQDGELSGRYVQQTMDDTGTGGIFEYIDILGGYFGNGGIADPDNYFILDEVRIADAYIGPPPGFVIGGDPPRPDAGPADTDAAVVRSDGGVRGDAAAGTLDGGAGTDAAVGTLDSGVAPGAEAGCSCTSARRPRGRTVSWVFALVPGLVLGWRRLRS